MTYWSQFQRFTAIPPCLCAWWCYIYIRVPHTASVVCHVSWHPLCSLCWISLWTNLYVFVGLPNGWEVAFDDDRRLYFVEWVFSGCSQSTINVSKIEATSVLPFKWAIGIQRALYVSEVSCKLNWIKFCLKTEMNWMWNSADQKLWSDLFMYFEAEPVPM